MNTEEADIPAAIRRAGSALQHVHLADSNRLLPGSGHTNFVTGFKALLDIGYDKYMALECGIPGDRRKGLPEAAHYLKRCIEEARELG